MFKLNWMLGLMLFFAVGCDTSPTLVQQMPDPNQEQGDAFDADDDTTMHTNQAPTAKSSSLSTQKDSPLKIDYLVSDPDGDELTISVVQQPKNGELSRINNAVVYTPNDGFEGQDSLQFTANDGELESEIAQISITVNTESLVVFLGGVYHQQALKVDPKTGEISVLSEWENTIYKGGSIVQPFSFEKEVYLGGNNGYWTLTKDEDKGLKMGAFTSLLSPANSFSDSSLFMNNGALYSGFHHKGKAHVFPLKVNEDGKLQVNGTKFETEAGSANIAFAGTQTRFSYVATPFYLGSVQMFEYDNDGNLANHKIFSNLSEGSVKLISHPSNKMLINICGSMIGCRNDQDMRVLSIDPQTGDLSLPLNADYAIDGKISDAELSEDGNYLYTVNEETNTISTYLVDSQKQSLTLDSSIETCVWPGQVTINETYQLLLVACEKENQVRSYRIDGGKLTALKSTTVLDSGEWIWELKVIK